MCRGAGSSGSKTFSPTPEHGGETHHPGFVNSPSHVEFHPTTYLKEDRFGIAANFTEGKQKTEFLLGDPLGNLRPMPPAQGTLPRSLVDAARGPVQLSRPTSHSPLKHKFNHTARHTACNSPHTQCCFSSHAFARAKPSAQHVLCLPPPTSNYSSSCFMMQQSDRAVMLEIKSNY